MTTIAPTSLAEIDTCDPNMYATDPHPVYRYLRENAPLYWDEKNELWVATKANDVLFVSQNPDLFCSGQGIRPYTSVDLSLIGLDEPRHTEQRRLINKGFTPRMIRNMESHIRDIATETIDKIADKGECDFVADISVHVPLIVIAELMGLPVEDRERFWHWSDDMMAGDGALEGDPKLTAAAVAFGEYVEYCTALVEDRRNLYRKAKEAEARGEEPPELGEDLISVLVAANEEGIIASGGEGEELQDDEFLMFLVVVVVAGNETTRNGMSGAMKILSENPDVWKRIIDDPALFDTATDELIRLVSPVISFCRTATQDVELSGQTIKKGQKVFMLYQSANRDSDRFDNPDEFSFDRDPTMHLAFGSGLHYCLGANLARLEIRVLFEELARRLPDIHVKPGTEARYVPHTLVHSIESLPVVFTPENA